MDSFPCACQFILSIIVCFDDNKKRVFVNKIQKIFLKINIEVHISD